MKRKELEKVLEEKKAGEVVEGVGGEGSGGSGVEG